MLFVLAALADPPSELPTGTVGGTLASGAVPPSDCELVVLRREMPAYPKAAKKQHLGEERCLAKVLIGNDGVPFEVTASECSEAFHPALQDALMRWRWAPPECEGESVKGQTTIGVTFKASGRPPKPKE
ncbi:MAG: energy transducer TonB [Alphaproteobacteria bacterium]|nr:energy transducer TonB [Alphaproteobacteria bacterium]